jgi:hypothetical protein
MSLSSMKRDQESGFWCEECIICFLSFPMKILAYEGAIVVPIAIPLICIICSPLNVKLLCFSINVSNWTIPSVGDSLTALWSQASPHRHYVGCQCIMTLHPLNKEWKEGVHGFHFKR